MSPDLRFPLLLSLGFAENEIRLYEAILDLGLAKPRELVERTGLGRPNVYHLLEVLEQKRLVMRVEGKQVRYQALDPANLRALIERRRDEVERTSHDLEILLPQLTRDYTLASGRPIVRVFEGVDGLHRAIDGLMETQAEILTYIDTSAVAGRLVEVDAYFEKQRKKTGLHNRLLVSDDDRSKEVFADPAPDSEVRFLHGFPHAFGAAFHVHGDRITYFASRNGNEIAVSIQEPAIVSMHRQQFEFLWQKARPREASAEKGA